MSSCIKCAFDEKENCFRSYEYNLLITKVAVEMILKKIDINKKLLRVFLSGGGCAGFKANFKFCLIEDKKDIDIIIGDDTGKPLLIIDEKSLKHIYGATLSYEKSIVRTGFIIIPKKGVSSCGCGFSFGS